MRKLIWLLLLISGTLMAQKPLNPPKAPKPGSQVELLNTDSLAILNNSTFQQRRFFGNVRFKHNGILLNCQTAVQNVTTNQIEAYGRVKIIQGDTLTITGDTLYYDGNSRFARIFGKKVVLTDKEVVLTTKQLNYDIPQSTAYFPQKGVIVQDSSVLTSDRGQYNTQTKVFQYRGNVEIKNPSVLICTDTLDYYSQTSEAVFLSPTQLFSSDGLIQAKKGRYNTQKKTSQFEGRTSITQDNYYLEGDTVSYDTPRKQGMAWGKVKLISQKDSVTLLGDRGYRDGILGESWVKGNAQMARVEKADTLFMKAGAMFAWEDTVQKEAQSFRRLMAIEKVRIWRHDFQAICDSLRYEIQDSTFSFFKDPLVWGKENQLKADTIRSFLQNNRLKKIQLDVNSLIVSPDTLINFNQVSGRAIEAHMNEAGQLRQVFVAGNGEALYYALDEKNKIIGLNRVESSKMRLDFEKSKISSIRFLGNPDGRLLPPKKIGSKETELESFQWFIDQKPVRSEFKSEDFF
ncbi:MAG: OstA-like protein [Spirosomataceae bacterium]